MVSVREAVESTDLEAFAEALAPDVVWVGLWPGQLCRNRDEVVEMLSRAEARAHAAKPEVVREAGDLLVVDPHLDGRHHVLVLRDGLVSEIRAYPDRESAFATTEDHPW